MENKYENKTYQDQLYLMYKNYQSQAMLLEKTEYHYQHNYVDNNDFINIFERCTDDFEKILVYALPLSVLTDEERTIALQGKFHCSVVLRSKLGDIKLDARANPYYQFEIELMNNRIKLPKDMFIGDIDEIVFLDNLSYCYIKCKDEKKLYHLSINRMYPKYNCFASI